MYGSQQIGKFICLLRNLYAGQEATVRMGHGTTDCFQIGKGVHQGGIRKDRGTTDQIANIRWIIEKAREFQKNIYVCFIDYAKALDYVITTNSGKFLKRW